VKGQREKNTNFVQCFVPSAGVLANRRVRIRITGGFHRGGGSGSRGVGSVVTTSTSWRSRTLRTVDHCSVAFDGRTRELLILMAVSTSPPSNQGMHQNRNFVGLNALEMMTFFSKLAGLDFSSGFQTGYKKGFKQSAGYKAGFAAGEAAQKQKESKSAYLAQHALSTPSLNAN
jgi:hypothetical protein